MQEKSRARPAVSLYLVGEEEGEGPGGGAMGGEMQFH